MRRWPLRPGLVNVGRDSACEIVVDDPLLSKRHLQLTVESGAAWVRDQDSKNGVWIDGERVREIRLPLDRWFAAGGTLFALREGVTLISDDSRRPVSVDDATTPITLTHHAPRSGNDLDEDTGDQSLPAWIARVVSSLAQGASRAHVMQTLLANAAEIAGSRTAALIADSSEGAILEAIHGPPLPATPTLDTALLRNVRGELHDPATDERFGIIEGHPATGADYWMVLLPAPPSSSPAMASLQLLAMWAIREAASIARPTVAITADYSAPRDVHVNDDEEPFLAVAAGSQAVLTQVDRAANSELPVLFVGDSGTGKELLAQRLHDKSRRSRGPFVAVNCAAIPAELLEAELFGIEKGVATGVSARLGRMALASGGTLFLDEIGDMPTTLQPKLLRALETRTITPLGAPSPEPVDIRLVAATHRDLRALATEERFRIDLYYRLAGATIRIPSLRERPDDVLPLARRFAQLAAKNGQRAFSGIDLEAARLLLGYEWPGNVRELKHAIERAVAFSDGPILHPGVLPPEITLGADTSHGDFLLSLRREYRDAKLEFERLYFKRLLERCRDNRSEAIQRSGLSRSQFYAKLAELSLGDGRIDDAE